MYWGAGVPELGSRGGSTSLLVFAAKKKMIRHVDRDKSNIYSDYTMLQRTIDKKDHKILSIIQSNARLSNAEISRRVGLAPSAVLERIRKLEDRGVIKGYRPKINPQAVNLGLLAFVFVRVKELPGKDTTGRELSKIPEVLEVHHVAGEDCYLTKVRTSNTEALGQLLREKFGALPTVRSTRTTIVLNTVKEDSRLPLGNGEGSLDAANVETKASV